MNNNSYKNKFNNLFYSIFSIALLYIVLFTAFYLTCFFDKDGLYKIIISKETYKYLPFSLSMKDLRLIANELMSYISGKLTFLETKVHIDGVLTEFYSLRSKIHMADVRNIIINLKKINYIAIILLIISFFKFINLKNCFSELKKYYFRVVIIITLTLTIISAFAIINFDAFFVKFHHVLFTNDLWLLDPSEDYIICLLPENVFMIYGLRIVISMLVSIILSFSLLHILSKIQSRQ